MIEISARVDHGNLLNAIRKYARDSGVTLQFVCYDTMRLWLIDLVRRSAPWADDGVLGSYREQRETGRNAVANDVDRLFAKYDPVLHTKWEHKKSGRLFIKKSDGTVLVIPPEYNMMKSDVAEIETIHKARRNSRGRVPRQARQFWTKKTTFNRYVRSVQKRVGSLKAGWVNALLHFSALSRGGLGRIPQWILGQSVRAGSYGGNIDNSGNGAIYATNNAHHWKAIRRDTIEYTRALREKDLQKMAYRRIGQLVKQFNSGQMTSPIRKAA